MWDDEFSESEPKRKLSEFERLKEFFFGKSKSWSDVVVSPHKLDGRCPLCGELGRYHLSVPVCSEHGPY
jgi:hypothetical protein